MFDDILIALLVLWVLLPFGLIPAVIVLAVKNSKLKKMLAGDLPADIVRRSEREKKERKPFNFSIILILGVLFVILSGVILATSGWNYMSEAFKMAALLSMSFIFFAASVFSERKFGLNKTGFAFWILGGIFLPVSVVAIAFFRLLGVAFAFNKQFSWRVFLAVMAVTAVVMLLSYRRYRGSREVRYIFASALAFEYIGFTFSIWSHIYGQIILEGHENITLAAAMLAGGYLLFMFVPQLKTLPAQIMFTVTLVICGYSESKGVIVAALLAVLCSVISVAVNRKAYSLAGIISFPVAVCSVINVFTQNFKTEYDRRDFLPFTLMSMVVLGVLAVIFGVPYLKKLASSGSDDGKTVHFDVIKLRWLERVCAFAVFLHYFNGWALLDDELGNTFALALITSIFFGIKAIMLSLEGGRDSDLRHALSFIGVIVAAALMRVEPPEFIEAEYYCISSFVATIPLLFIWKKRRGIAEMTVFVHSIIALAILLQNAYDEEEIINAVILLGICTIMMVISFIRRAKKWFILSVISVLVIVLVLTTSVWETVSWWVYLLAVGIILIIYAGVNENCKQKGVENPIKNCINSVFGKVWR